MKLLKYIGIDIKTEQYLQIKIQIKIKLKILLRI